MIIIWDPAVLQCDSRTSDLGVLCVTAELLIQQSYCVIAELMIQQSYCGIAEPLIQQFYFVIAHDSDPAVLLCYSRTSGGTGR